MSAPTPGPFQGPALHNGDRVAVQLSDGTLHMAYWYQGKIVDELPADGAS